MFFKPSVSACIAVLTLFCVGDAALAAKAGATAKTTVGTVERAETVKLDSNDGKGAIASSAQGDSSGRKYTVRTGQGGALSIVSDQKEARVGDCVVIEESGSTANI